MKFLLFVMSFLCVFSGCSKVDNQNASDTEKPSKNIIQIRMFSMTGWELSNNLDDEFGTGAPIAFEPGGVVLYPDDATKRDWIGYLVLIEGKFKIIGSKGHPNILVEPVNLNDGFEINIFQNFMKFIYPDGTIKIVRKMSC